MRKLFVLAFAAAAVFCSCNKQDPEYREIVSLGAKEKSVVCGTAYGSCEFDVYADIYVNSKETSPIVYHADIIGDASWLCFKENASSSIRKKGSGKLSLVYDANKGVKRSARLVLSYSNRTDTLTVYQQGEFNEYVILSGEYDQVPKEGGTYSATIQTNVLPANLKVSASNGVESWKFGKNTIEFVIGASDSRDNRDITVMVYTVDGWGDTISGSVKLSQKPGK